MAYLFNKKPIREEKDIISIGCMLKSWLHKAVKIQQFSYQKMKCNWFFTHEQYMIIITRMNI